MIRAGLLITGTEVLSGAVSDRNGPWLSRRLQEVGVEVAQICIVGDRPQDMQQALRQMEEHRLDLVVSSGGLGPTEDDRTVAEVARWLGVELALDAALERRIEEIVRPLRTRRNVDPEAMSAGNRKQATVPAGASVLEPVGTAPGLVIAPPRPLSPTVVVLPGPPRELQPMWRAALETETMRAAIASLPPADVRTMRLFGVPESQLAQTLRQAERDGVPLRRLEVSTCQHRGEVEVSTRVAAGERDSYAAFESYLAAAHGEELFSRDGSTVDEQVAQLLAAGGEWIATAESCTGGMLCARLTDLPGSSRYVRGGVVAYSNEVKVSAVGVPSEQLERHGAVSAEVAGALADGARLRLDASVGVGITGIAGPGGATDEKPVGLVWIAVCGPRGRRLVRSVQLPGGRAEVRERAVTVAMHLVRRALMTQVD